MRALRDLRTDNLFESVDAFACGIESVHEMHFCFRLGFCLCLCVSILGICVWEFRFEVSVTEKKGALVFCSILQFYPAIPFCGHRFGKKGNVRGIGFNRNHLDCVSTQLSLILNPQSSTQPQSSIRPYPP